MTRPWQSPVPPLKDSVTKEIPFPTAETEDGIVRVGVRGPSALDRLAMAAAGVLMEYLADTAVAPIQRDLVEVRPITALFIIIIVLYHHHLIDR